MSPFALFTSTHDQWVPDLPYIRLMNGMKLKVTQSDGKVWGVFILHVLERDKQGHSEPGKIMVALEPCDTQAVLTVIENLKP